MNDEMKARIFQLAFNVVCVIIVGLLVVSVVKLKSAFEAEAAAADVQDVNDPNRVSFELDILDPNNTFSDSWYKDDKHYNIRDSLIALKEAVSSLDARISKLEENK